MTKHQILLAIIIIGSVFRFWELSKIPAILNRDEAALAYNSYLLSQTGMDEWGREWPLTLESFGDFKLPGYPILLMPFLAVFPWSDVAVKLPSVLAGIGLIISVYLLGDRFYLSQKQRLLAAFLVSITPIFIFYSRIAFEANLALFFFTTAVWFLLRPTTDFKHNIVTDLMACLLMLAAVLTYNTPLLLLPFIIMLLPMYRGLTSFKKWLVPTVILGIIEIAIFWLLLPITQQKSGITLFNDETTWMNWINFRSQLSGWSQFILGNKYLYQLGLIFKNFADSFSVQFMVTEGGTHPWHSISGRGHIFATVYGLGILGIVLSFLKIWIDLKNQTHWSQFFKQQKNNLLLLYLLIISLSPSVITVDSPHATRSLFFFVCFILFAVKALSIDRWPFNFHLSTTLKKKLVLILLLVIGLEASSYTYQYFVNYPQHQPESLQIGFDQAIQKAAASHPDQPIAVVDSEGYTYILAAWYLKIPAQQFFDTIVKQQSNTIGFRYGERVGNLHFISQPADRSDQESALIQHQAGEWMIEE